MTNRRLMAVVTMAFTGGMLIGIPVQMGVGRDLLYAGGTLYLGSHYLAQTHTEFEEKPATLATKILLILLVLATMLLGLGVGMAEGWVARATLKSQGIEWSGMGLE